MKRYLFIVCVFFFASCSQLRKQKMDTKNKNFACDVETGVCTPHNGEKAQQLQPIKENKLKITYYYDALCGWCYGFSPEFATFYEANKEVIDFDVVSGGLFLGSRVGKIEEVAPYIKAGAYKSVESVTGTKFGEAFLNDMFGEGKMTLNSLPPAIALCIVKEKFPEKKMEFAGILLNAFYYDGLDANDLASYTKYAEKIGFDASEFEAKMKEEKYEKMAQAEFQIFQESGASGMPALVVETEEGPKLLSSGYASAKDLQKRVAPLLK